MVSVVCVLHAQFPSAQMDDAAWRWLVGDQPRIEVARPPPLLEIVNLLSVSSSPEPAALPSRGVVTLAARVPSVVSPAAPASSNAVAYINTPASTAAVGHIHTPDYEFARVHGYFIDGNGTKVSINWYGLTAAPSHSHALFLRGLVGTDFLPAFLETIAVSSHLPSVMPSLLPTGSGDGLFHVAAVDIPFDIDLIFFVAPVTELHYFKEKEEADYHQSHLEATDPRIFFLREEVALVPSAASCSWAEVHVLIGFLDDLASKANSATYGLVAGTDAHRRAKKNVNVEIVCTDDPLAPPVEIASTGQKFNRPRWSLRATRIIRHHHQPIELLLDYGEGYFEDLRVSPTTHRRMCTSSSTCGSVIY